VAKIRLVRKLAPILNGIDLSKHQVGEVIDVSERVALMLIREGWAKWATGEKRAVKSKSGDVPAARSDRNAPRFSSKRGRTS